MNESERYDNSNRHEQASNASRDADPSGTAPATLANNGKAKTGASAGSVPAEPQAPAEPTPIADINVLSSEDQEAYIERWVEYLSYSEPRTLSELESQLGKHLNDGWLACTIVKRAVGLAKRKRFSATMVEISDGKYAGVDWIRENPDASPAIT